MLNISFFITAFFSIFWLIYSFNYINLEKILSEKQLDVLFQNIIFVLLPIIAIWGIFTIIKSHFTTKKVFYCFYNQLEQIKKQNEINLNLIKSLQSIDAEKQNNTNTQEFNLLVSDINEILAEIIKRSNSISSTQLEHLWTRIANGERWVMAKTIIDIINYQSDFAEKLKEKALKDKLLKGSLMEFYARYKTLQKIISTKNENNFFYEMIEYGSFGKIFEILTPIIKTLSQEKASTTVSEKIERPVTNTNNFSLTEEEFSIPSFLKEQTTEQNITKPSISLPNTTESIDQGLRAIKDELLADNSHQEKNTNKQATVYDINQNKRKMPTISLDELEKEINSSPENNYDEFAYPFGAWLDGKNNN